MKIFFFFSQLWKASIPANGMDSSICWKHPLVPVASIPVTDSPINFNLGFDWTLLVLIMQWSVSLYCWSACSCQPFVLLRGKPLNCFVGLENYLLFRFICPSIKSDQFLKGNPTGWCCLYHVSRGDVSCLFPGYRYFAFQSFFFWPDCFLQPCSLRFLTLHKYPLDFVVIMFSRQVENFMVHVYLQERNPNIEGKNCKDLYPCIISCLRTIKLQNKLNVSK